MNWCGLLHGIGSVAKVVLPLVVDVCTGRRKAGARRRPGPPRLSRARRLAAQLRQRRSSGGGPRRRLTGHGDVAHRRDRSVSSL
ncbi:hypothetical protein [Catenuloplanes japonicus]|uniref:hypothetical protein n=1 Tax=Catenuloplanes japonicus TaxID=33876 RepID=UPI0005255F19|nr:hypothetical protein [Catenuloplanes japonicus]